MVKVPELLLDQSPSRDDAKIISKYHTKILELLKKTDENTQIYCLIYMRSLLDLTLSNTIQSKFRTCKYLIEN